jgi:hypothetical protein
MLQFKLQPAPSIQVVCNGETKQFQSYWQAEHYFYILRSEQETVQRQARAEEVYKEGVRYIYQAKFVLEVKFDFWVAKSKDHKYNIRKDGKAFMFGKQKMFGLDGRELLEFYNRYVKVIALL